MKMYTMIYFFPETLYISVVVYDFTYIKTYALNDEQFTTFEGTII